MSQDYTLPLALSTTVSTFLSDLQDAADALLTLHSGTSAPSSPSAGQLWHDTTNNILKIRNQANSAWINLIADTTVTSGGLLPLTGGTMTGAIAMGSQKVTGLAAGTATSDAVRKGQIDGVERVACVSVGSISATTNAYLLTGMQAITVVDCSLVASSATTSTGSDFWDINVRNLTAGADLRSADYDTNADGDFAADTNLDVGLDQNLSVSADAVLQVQVEKNGSASNLDDLFAVLRYTVAV